MTCLDSRSAERRGLTSLQILRTPSTSRLCSLPALAGLPICHLNDVVVTARLSVGLDSESLNAFDYLLRHLHSTLGVVEIRHVTKVAKIKRNIFLGLCNQNNFLA